LERRPDFLAGEASPVALAAHTAAAGGHTHELANLAALLLHPSTTAVDVAAVARAIAELDDPAALAAASEFVRRYHADPSVVFESLAIFHCVDYLARRASSRDADKSDAARALEVLREVARDPFTEARLAAYIRRGLVPPSARVR
jgi:hypothetical protein